MPRLACWRPAVLRQALSGGELQPAVARAMPVHQGVRQVPGTRRCSSRWTVRQHGQAPSVIRHRTAAVARRACVCGHLDGIQGDLRGTAGAKPARAPRGYASVASDRHGRPLHLAVRQPYEVDSVCASHGREPVAAQHGNPWRRAGFGCIAGGKRPELVVLDGLPHSGFARDPLRHGHAFTTT